MNQITDSITGASTTPPPRSYSRLALAAFGLGVLVVVAALLSGFGSRAGLWTFRTGFQVLRYSVYLAGVATVVSLVAAVRTRPGTGRRGFALALAGLVFGLIGGLVPMANARSAGKVPSIHDITTDTQDPPQFLAVLPAREGASNSSVYGGPEIAAQQQAAYPDIKTEVLRATPDDAFNRALEAAREMGWEIVATVPEDGRIEATATTFWFGFKDDVVIRIRPEGANSRVDVRSVSRVGRGDVGTNARRIRKYLEELREE
jgi:uncharacterized protein (DUF1499 family)